MCALIRGMTKYPITPDQMLSPAIVSCLILYLVITPKWGDDALADVITCKLNSTSSPQIIIHRILTTSNEDQDEKTEEIK